MTDKQDDKLTSFNEELKKLNKILLANCMKSWLGMLIVFDLLINSLSKSPPHHHLRRIRKSNAANYDVMDNFEKLFFGLFLLGNLLVPLYNFFIYAFKNVFAKTKNFDLTYTEIQYLYTILSASETDINILLDNLQLEHTKFIHYNEKSFNLKKIKNFCKINDLSHIENIMSFLDEAPNLATLLADNYHDIPKVFKFINSSIQEISLINVLIGNITQTDLSNFKHMSLRLKEQHLKMILPNENFKRIEKLLSKLDKKLHDKALLIMYRLIYCPKDNQEELIKRTFYQLTEKNHPFWYLARTSTIFILRVTSVPLLCFFSVCTFFELPALYKLAYGVTISFSTTTNIIGGIIFAGIGLAQAKTAVFQLKANINELFSYFCILYYQKQKKLKRLLKDFILFLPFLPCLFTLSYDASSLIFEVIASASIKVNFFMIYMLGFFTTCVVVSQMQPDPSHYKTLIKRFRSMGLSWDSIRFGIIGSGVIVGICLTTPLSTISYFVVFTLAVTVCSAGFYYLLDMPHNTKDLKIWFNDNKPHHFLISVISYFNLLFLSITAALPASKFIRSMFPSFQKETMRICKTIIELLVTLSFIICYGSTTNIKYSQNEIKSYDKNICNPEGSKSLAANKAEEVYKVLSYNNGHKDGAPNEHTELAI